MNRRTERLSRKIIVAMDESHIMEIGPIVVLSTSFNICFAISPGRAPLESSSGMQHGDVSTLPGLWTSNIENVLFGCWKTIFQKQTSSPWEFAPGSFWDTSQAMDGANSVAGAVVSRGGKTRGTDDGNEVHFGDHFRKPKCIPSSTPTWLEIESHDSRLLLENIYEL